MASFARILGSAIARAGRGATALLGSRTGARAAAHASRLLAPVVETATSRGKLRFRCGSAMAARHAADFQTHEPDTRLWIDEHIRAGEHLWDIGANVGLYSLYAAVGHGVTVTSFEPVASTFAELTDNVALTGVADRVLPLCVALSDHDGLAPLFLTSTEPGTAMHALGAPENVHGRFEPARIQQVPAFRGDDLANYLQLGRPQHVKIDVDGHELKVLDGLGGLLQGVRSIWIEVEQGDAAIEAFLVRKGFESGRGHGGRNRLFLNSRND